MCPVRPQREARAAHKKNGCIYRGQKLLITIFDVVEEYVHANRLLFAHVSSWFGIYVLCVYVCVTYSLPPIHEHPTAPSSLVCVASLLSDVTWRLRL